MENTINLSKIKGLLAENDYSKKDLAILLNLSQNSIYKKLKGKVPFKLEEAKKISDLFNVSIDIFFE